MPHEGKRYVIGEGNEEVNRVYCHVKETAASQILSCVSNDHSVNCFQITQHAAVIHDLLDSLLAQPDIIRGSWLLPLLITAVEGEVRILERGCSTAKKIVVGSERQNYMELTDGWKAKMEVALGELRVLAQAEGEGGSDALDGSEL